MKRPSLCRTLPLLGVLVALPLALVLVTGALGNRAGRESLSLAQKLGYHFHREYKAYRVSTSV